MNSRWRSLKDVAKLLVAVVKSLLGLLTLGDLVLRPAGNPDEFLVVGLGLLGGIALEQEVVQRLFVTDQHPVAEHELPEEEDRQDGVERRGQPAWNCDRLPVWPGRPGPRRSD